MIYEKDYILRLIALMGEFLRRLKHAAEDGLFDAGLDAFLREQGGLSLKAALGLDVSALADMTDLRARLAVVMALEVKAERSDPSLEEKALRLLVTMKEEPEVCRGMEDTAYRLLLSSAETLDSHAMLDAAVFLREAGRLDRMDSAAFLLWEGLPEGAKPLWRTRLSELYAPLLAMGEDALLRGGLSQEEVNDSLRAFAGEARET